MKCATFVLPGVPIKPLFDRLVWALGSYSPFHEAAWLLWDQLCADYRSIISLLGINSVSLFPLQYHLLLSLSIGALSFPSQPHTRTHTYTHWLLEAGSKRIQVCCINLHILILLQPAAAHSQQAGGMNPFVIIMRHLNPINALKWEPLEMGVWKITAEEGKSHCEIFS